MKKTLLVCAAVLMFGIPAAQAAEVIISTGSHHRHHRDRFDERDANRHSWRRDAWRRHEMERRHHHRSDDRGAAIILRSDKEPRHHRRHHGGTVVIQSE